MIKTKKNDALINNESEANLDEKTNNASTKIDYYLQTDKLKQMSTTEIENFLFRLKKIDPKGDRYSQVGKSSVNIVNERWEDGCVFQVIEKNTIVKNDGLGTEESIINLSTVDRVKRISGSEVDCDKRKSQVDTTEVTYHKTSDTLPFDIELDENYKDYLPQMVGWALSESSAVIKLTVTDIETGYDMDLLNLVRLDLNDGIIYESLIRIKGKDNKVIQELSYGGYEISKLANIEEMKDIGIDRVGYCQLLEISDEHEYRCRYDELTKKSNGNNDENITLGDILKK